MENIMGSKMLSKFECSTYQKDNAIETFKTCYAYSKNPLRIKVVRL